MCKDFYDTITADKAAIERIIKKDNTLKSLIGHINQIDNDSVQSIQYIYQNEPSPLHYEFYDLIDGNGYIVSYNTRWNSVMTSVTIKREDLNQ